MPVFGENNDVIVESPGVPNVLASPPATPNITIAAPVVSNVTVTNPGVPDVTANAPAVPGTIVVPIAGAPGPAGAGVTELFDSATVPASPPATYLRFSRDGAGDVQTIFLGTVT